MPIQLPSLRELTRRLAACHGGNSAVEFSVAVPFLVLLAFGAYDYGSAYVESVRLNGAARAGAQQALYDPSGWQDTAAAAQLALEEYVGRTLTTDEIAALPVTATATAFCACTAGATVACGGTCPGGAAPGRFVQVDMSNAVPLTLPYPWETGDRRTVDGRAVVRVH